MVYSRKTHSFCINLKWLRETRLFVSLSQHTHWHHLHYKNLLPADSNVPPMTVSYRGKQKSVYGNLFSFFIGKMLGGKKAKLCVCFSHRREVMDVSLPYEHRLRAGAKRCDCSERCQNPSEAPDSIYPPCTFYTADWELYVFQSCKWTISLDQVDHRDKYVFFVFCFLFVFSARHYCFQNIV